MKKEITTYEELARRVGDAVLFNNHNAHNDQWHDTIYEQPLMTARLEEIDAENRQYKVDAIERSTDEAEKAKLTEELAEDDENGERATVYDFEIYQTYHITRNGAEYLFNHTAELISYDERLEAFLWHIGHYGTAWSGVQVAVYDFEDFSDESTEKYISIDDADKYFVG